MPIDFEPIKEEEPQKPKIDFTPIDFEPEKVVEEPKAEATPVISQAPIAVQPEDTRSAFKKGWDAITDPLVSLGGAGNTPESRAAHELMQQEHPWLTAGMDFGTGLASLATSPLTLATLGAGGAEAAAAKFGLP